MLGAQVFSRRNGRMLRRFELLNELVRCAEDIFPGVIVIPHELVKYEENDEVVVDLVLIDLEGRHWWVAKVIPSVSDFKRDVFLSVYALSRTRYLSEDSEAVAAHVEDVSIRDAVREIMMGEPPGVVVFVSNPDPSWYEETRRAGGQMAVAESFSSGTGDRLLRINGDLPRATGTYVADCEALPGMDHVLRVLDFASEWPAEEALVELEGELILEKARVIENDVLIYAAPGQTITPGGEPIGLWQLRPQHFSIRPRSSGSR